MEGRNHTMKNRRFLYALLILATICFGLLSRKIKGIPLFVGDVLYAVMIYFMIRFLFSKAKAQKIAFISLLICYAIETFQLCQAEWILSIRNTTVGHLVLGQGFLWSDMIAYTMGIGIIFLIENSLNKSSDIP